MAASVITVLFLFSCLLQSASADLQEQEVTAHPGQTVTLSCRAPNNVIITAVEWIRSGLDLDRYVYLKEDGRLNTANQDPSYMNRVHLKDDEMKNGELSLILKNVNSKDKGGYECRYEEKGSWKRADQIKLTVILDAGDLQLQPIKEITVHPGDDVTLPCRAPNYITITTVDWSRSGLNKRVFSQRDGNLNTAGQDPSYVNRVQLRDDEMKNGELSVILKNVNNNDGGTYECRYKEERGRNLETADQIKLTVIPDAGELQVRRTRITSYRGQSVTLQSRAPVGVPVIAVKWIRTDLQKYIFLKRDDYRDYTDQHQSYANRVRLMHDAMMANGELSLILNNVNRNDAGTYQCYYKTTGDCYSDETFKLTGEVDLVVIELPPPPPTPPPPPPPTPKPPCPGPDVILPCQTRDVPIATVRWIRTDLPKHVFFKQNEYLDTAGQDASYVNRVRLMNDAMMVNGELSLIVNKMNSRDTGTYQCYYKKPGECYTDELFKLANTVQLNGRDLHILVECGGTITMPCRAPRNTFIRDVEWIRSDPDRHVYHQRSKRLVTEDQDPSYVNRVQLEDDEMKNGDLSLILKNVSSNDEGRYECRYVEGRGRRKRAAFDDEPITIVYLKVTGPTDGDAESGKLSGRGDSSVILPVTLIAALVVVGLVGFVIFKKLKGRSENNPDLPDDDPDVLQQLQVNENSQ